MPFDKPRDSEMLIAANMPSNSSVSGSKASNAEFGWNIKTLRMRSLGSPHRTVQVGESEDLDISAMFDISAVLDPNCFSYYEDGSNIYSSKAAPNAITALENIKIFNRFGEFTAEEQETMFMACYSVFVLLKSGTNMPEKMGLEHIEMGIHPADQSDFQQATDWKPRIDTAHDPIAYPAAGEYKKLEKHELRIVVKPLKQYQGKKGRVARPVYTWAWNRETGRMRQLKGPENLLKISNPKEWHLPVFEACRRLDHNFPITPKVSESIQNRYKNTDKLSANCENIKQYYRDGKLLKAEKEKVRDMAANVALCLLHGDGKSQMPKPLNSSRIKNDTSGDPRHIKYTVTSLPD